MREILFRAKGLYKDCWYYGDFVKCRRHMTYQIIDLDEQEMKLGHYVKIDTIGQYTGLCDKNGTKIFEGDIVKGTIVSQWAKQEIICVVRYVNDKFVTIEDNKWEHSLMFAKKIEVIGNIYDNPELLEK